MPDPLISLKNIHFYLGETHALKGLDWEIRERENWAILGPNGSGKSALLKLLSGDGYPLPNAQTEFQFFGKNRLEPGVSIWDVRGQVGLVSPELQSRYLPNTLGLEVVLSGFFSSIGLYKTATAGQKKQAQDSLERLGAGDLSHRAISEMSYGQARRLLIARALIHNPKILILDEPTNGLDMDAGEKFLETLTSLAKEGVSLVIATHHLHEIILPVTHIAFLKNGDIFKSGRKVEILQEPVLSEAFGTSLRIHRSAGRFWALPGV